MGTSQSEPVHNYKRVDKDLDDLDKLVAKFGNISFLTATTKQITTQQIIPSNNDQIVYIRKGGHVYHTNKGCCGSSVKILKSQTSLCLCTCCGFDRKSISKKIVTTPVYTCSTKSVVYHFKYGCGSAKKKISSGYLRCSPCMRCCDGNNQINHLPPSRKI
jgi:hypothetical protein